MGGRLILQTLVAVLAGVALGLLLSLAVGRFTGMNIALGVTAVLAGWIGWRMFR